jgi:hypothetical protein
MNPTAPPIHEMTDETTGPPRSEVEDAVIEEARRRARRRRRTYASAAAAVVVVAATAITTLDNTPPTRGTTAAGTSDTGGSPGVVDTPRDVGLAGVPWCVPDPVDPDRAERIVGAGPPVKTWCSYRPRGSDGSQPFNEHRQRWLIYHAGSTILVTDSHIYRVADGKLTNLGPQGDFKLSHDGRYLAVSRGECGEVLSIYRVATAEKLAQTTVPGLASGCATLAGLDDQGRVYLNDDSGRDQQPLDLQMYDMRNHQWHPVTGLPRVPGYAAERSTELEQLGPTSISYFTANGFAVTVDERRFNTEGGESEVRLSSVEGVVDVTGRFTWERWVSIGRGLWSPDRSLVAEQRLEGVFVRSAADTTTRVMLDLPAEQYGGPVAAGFAGATGIEWVSGHTVLVNSMVYGSVYRCEARTGSCTRIRPPGFPSFGVVESTPG